MAVRPLKLLSSAGGTAANRPPLVRNICALCELSLAQSLSCFGLTTLSCADRHHFSKWLAPSGDDAANSAIGQIAGMERPSCVSQLDIGTTRRAPSGRKTGADPVRRTRPMPSQKGASVRNSSGQPRRSARRPCYRACIVPYLTPPG